MYDFSEALCGTVQLAGLKIHLSAKCWDEQELNSHFSELLHVRLPLVVPLCPYTGAYVIYECYTIAFYSSPEYVLLL